MSLLLGRARAAATGCVACVSGRARGRGAAARGRRRDRLRRLARRRAARAGRHERRAACRRSRAGPARAASSRAARDTPRAAADARPDRGQGPDRGVPLARRARRGRRAAPASRAIAQEAETAGLVTHWGRKVLEIRPPVPIDKGQAVARARAGARRCAAALFGGDDATDLDAFDALDELRREGRSTPRCAWACARTRGRPRSSSAPTSWWTARRASSQVLESLAPR